MPTASGDPHDQIAAFHAAMERRGAEASSMSLFRLGDFPVDPASTCSRQDAIYVTGGSMVNLMALWREHGIDRLMREAHERGILLCGYSAGSMCWFESGHLARRRRPRPRRRDRAGRAAATASTTRRTPPAATPTGGRSPTAASAPGSPSTTTPRR